MLSGRGLWGLDLQPRVGPDAAQHKDQHSASGWRL